MIIEILQSVIIITIKIIKVIEIFEIFWSIIKTDNYMIFRSTYDCIPSDK